jgi:hypothetical protein
MDAATFLSDLDTAQLKAFAKEVGTTVGVLRNIKCGKPMGPELASKFEMASSNRGDNQTVHRWVSMPARWHVIWPELVGAKGAPPVPEVEEGQAA